MEILLVLALCVITLCIAGVVFIALLKTSPQPPQPLPRIEVPPAEHYAPPAEDYAQLAEHYARPFEHYARQLAAVTRPGVTFRKKQIMSRDEFDLFWPP
jgi:hypothetical protein